MAATPSVSIAEEESLHDTKQWHWMIHVKKIGRRNVLVAMDSDSRFCMLFRGIKKGDNTSFINQFLNRLTSHTAGISAVAELNNVFLRECTNKFFASHSNHKFIQRGDRSVQTHITDVFSSLRYDFDEWYDLPDEDLFLGDSHYNETLRKRKQDKDYIYPFQEFFRAWASNYSSLSTNEIKATIQQIEDTKRTFWQQCHEAFSNWNVEHLEQRLNNSGFSFDKDESDKFENNFKSRHQESDNALKKSDKTLTVKTKANNNVICFDDFVKRKAK